MTHYSILIGSFHIFKLLFLDKYEPCQHGEIFLIILNDNERNLLRIHLCCLVYKSNNFEKLIDDKMSDLKRHENFDEYKKLYIDLFNFKEKLIKPISQELISYFPEYQDSEEKADSQSNNSNAKSSPPEKRFRNRLYRVISNEQRNDDDYQYIYILSEKGLWNENLARLDPERFLEIKSSAESALGVGDPGAKLSELLLGWQKDNYPSFQTNTDTGLIKDLFGETESESLKVHFTAIRLDDVKRKSICVSRFTFTRNIKSVISQPIRFKEERVSISGGSTVASKTYGLVMSMRHQKNCFKLIGQSSNWPFGEHNGMSPEQIRPFSTLFTCDLSFQRPASTLCGVYLNQMVSNDRLGSFATKIVLFREGVTTAATGKMLVLHKLLETFNCPHMLKKYIKNKGFTDAQLDEIINNKIALKNSDLNINYSDLYDNNYPDELKKPYLIKGADVVDLLRSAELKSHFLDSYQFESRKIGNIELQPNNELLGYLYHRVKNFIMDGEHDFGFLLY